MTDEAERLYERLLVLRCQTGDEDAYRELVGRFGPRLKYFLHRLIDTPGDADDLAQEVWLDVLRQLPRLAEAGAFTSWLYRIAHGKAMLYLRQIGRFPTTTDEVGEIAEPDVGSFSADDAASIHVALDDLEPVQREALVLRFLEGLTYEQISQIVECPVGTVRSRIHYAKAHLRRILERESK